MTCRLVAIAVDEGGTPFVDQIRESRELFHGVIGSAADAEPDLQDAAILIDGALEAISEGAFMVGLVDMYAACEAHGYPSIAK